MASFESVAEEYNAARPSYPSAVFDALGDLSGVQVLDIGAGTGIATRHLLDRGASVIAIDRGPAVLSRAKSHTPCLIAVVADGAVLPFPDASMDLLCFAQAWHWLDESTRCGEAHRVLRHAGRWAAWWSHARADNLAWFDTYWSTIESACPGAHRSQRDTDWGAGVAESGLFEVGDRIVVPWTREISVDDWITDQTTHSYVVALSPSARLRLLADLRAILDHQLPSKTMTIPYETSLWIGRKV